MSSSCKADEKKLCEKGDYQAPGFFNELIKLRMMFLMWVKSARIKSRLSLNPVIGLLEINRW